MGNYIQGVLVKKVTRKEFLVYFGMLILSISGIPILLKTLSKVKPNKKFPKSAFGSGPYGI